MVVAVILNDRLRCRLPIELRRVLGLMEPGLGYLLSDNIV